jgi:ATP-dependent RNA helicase DeaD
VSILPGKFIKRLELTRASLRECLLQGDLDEVRTVIESLTDEFDVIDVAAAAVKLAQVAVRRDGDVEIPETRRLEPIADGRGRGRTARPSRPPRGGDNMTRIFVGAGRQSGVRPADLVGAIAGEAGIASRELGAIEIADRFALIEVPEERADDIVAAMKKAALRGQKVQVRRDREGPHAAGT